MLGRQPKENLFDKREIPLHALVFSAVTESLSTRAAEDTDHRGQRLKQRPWLASYLALLEEKGGEEYVLYCDGNLKGLVVPMALAEMRNSLQASCCCR
jgi:hypothetical protein